MKINSTIQRTFWGALLTVFLGVSQAANFTVDQVLLDGVDATPGDGICATGGGSCTLRAAVMETNALAGADSINIPAGTYSLALGSTGEDLAAEGDLDILDDLTISGADAATTIINGNSFLYRIFSILKRVDNTLPVVSINKLTLTQGLSDINGALIYNEGELSLDDITLTDASLDSRAMVNVSGNFTISNSRVTDNESGIYSSTGNVNITNSEFSNNIATGKDGAAFYHDGGTATISDTIFSTNKNSDSGGAIYQGASSSLYIDSCQFIGNIITNSGSGGALNSSGYIQISNSSFDSNEAVGDGGAITLISSASGVIVDSSFSNNIAALNGGGIYTDGSIDFRLKRVTMSGNQATNGDGGALHIRLAEEDTFQLSESILTNNSAGDFGGGIYLTGVNNNSILRHSEISDNTAASGGGMTTSVSISLENITITGNTAIVDGGGLYNDSASDEIMELIHVSLANNISPVNTGANITNNLGIVRLSNTLIAYPVIGNNCSGNITTLGYNLSNDASCGLEAEDLPIIDPLLSPLADNGGFTKTLALQATSPAIDAGSTVLCASLNPLDQRFYYRSDAICDIGAYEAGSVLAQSGTLAFSASSYSVNEGDGIATVKFTRVGGSEGIVSVPYFDNQIGTAEIADYDSIIKTRLEWADGDSSDKTLDITIYDDITTEDDETILLELESDALVYGGASLGLSTATVTIVDDDTDPGVISIETSLYAVSEDVGTITFNLLRTGGTDGAVSVDVTFEDGSALFGSDYSASSQSFTATFLDGEFSISETITITDDSILELEESFTIRINNPLGGASLGLSTATVTIADNDTAPGVISIESSLYAVSEDVGIITFNLLRTGGTDGAVSVDVTFEDGSALFGSDYSASSQSFIATFLDGESRISETITITDDSIEELEESFIIRINNPQGGATLGAITGAAVAITDNDSSASTNTSTSSGSGGGGSMHPALLFGLLFLKFGIRRRKK